MHRVTVLMSVFNGIPHLKETIESIQQQTFEEWQFVIVNDGSDDGTQAFLDGLDDSRIRVITQTNQGLAAALNRGLGEIDTEYVARIDSDDIAMPQRLERQVEFLDMHPEVGLVGTQAVWRSDTGVGNNLSLPVEHRSIIRSLEHGQHAVTHSTIMARTALITEIGGYWDEGVSEDWDLFLRLGERTRLANLDEVLNRIRIAEGSLTGKNLFVVRARIHFACALASRRRSGAPLMTFQEYMAPSWRRMYLRINTAARTEYRLAVIDRLAGRRVRSVLRMALAALGAPMTAFYRARRGLEGYLRHHRSASH